MLLLIVRCTMSYFVLLLFTRLMGKKHLSQLTYFDYIVGITIGSVAAEVSVRQEVTLSSGLFAIIIWASLNILISIITMYNITLRKWIDSEPLLIIHGGKVMYKNMKKARYNVGDLLIQLRNKDIFNITDVDTAVLEPDGKLSVLKKSGMECVTCSDLQLQKPAVGMMTDLVLDGKILTKHLSEVGKDAGWVFSTLYERKIYDLRQVVYAGLQADGEVYVVTK